MSFGETLTRKRTVLIVDDDKGIHLATKYVLREHFECLSAYDSDEAKAIVSNQPVDVVLLDLHMRRANEGLQCLPQLKEIDAELDVIMVSASTDIDLAGRAMKSGASAYLVKEHSADQLIITIESVLSRRELSRQNQHYVRDRGRALKKNQIIGESQAIAKLLRDIEKVSRSHANVVITAETGCGKELVARHVGAMGGKPFVAVDSATITSSMAESILFGHERGSFTGAAGRSKGLFEEADGGTIYFDEIGNMPLDIQSKLLRVIEEKEITRLGSTKVVPLEFRVICASNQDLETLVAQGKFKADLYQRLNVISLRIPPLRERTDDIPALVSHFLQKFESPTAPNAVSDAAMDLLMKYSWPGNVRELSNLIANLCTMINDRDTIEVEDLPAKIRETEGVAVPCIEPTAEGFDFYRYMHTVEGRVLRELYKTCKGNILQMSKTLKMSRSHLYAKLNTHGIHS